MLKITNNKSLLYGSLICTIGAFFYCYEFILRIIPGTLQKELSTAFGNISATTFGQISAFYYFAYSPMQLPVGMLIDRFGPRKLLTIACLCCAAGSYFFLQTSSLPTVAMGRFLVGFGSSFAFVGALTLTLIWLPKNYFSFVAGLITTLGMLGIMYGEINITSLSIAIGWEYVLRSLVWIGILLSVIIFFAIRNNPNKAQTEPRTYFIKEVWEVLSSSQIWIIGIIGAFLYTSLSVFGELWGKTYLQYGHHLSKIQAAQTISILFLGWAIGAPLAGYLSDKIGKQRLILFIGALGSLISISLVLYTKALTFFHLNVLILIYGLFSSTEIIVFIMAKDICHVRLASTVFASINMIVTLGGVFLQPLVGKILDLSGNHMLLTTEHVYTIASYQKALAILPLSLLGVMILVFFIKDNK